MMRGMKCITPDQAARILVNDNHFSEESLRANVFFKDLPDLSTVDDYVTADNSRQVVIVDPMNA